MITEQHNEIIKKLIGVKIVKNITKQGELTLEKIYEFAENIHPLKDSHPAQLRVIQPKQAVTDDYYENRLNLNVDENNIITYVDWG